MRRRAVRQPKVDYMRHLTRDAITAAGLTSGGHARGLRYTFAPRALELEAPARAVRVAKLDEARKQGGTLK
jgi:hypothetical protein